MNARGFYGSGGGLTIGHGRSAYVGIHTPAESDHAVRQIDTEMNAIVDAMYRAMGADPSIRNPPFSPDEVDRAIKEHRPVPDYIKAFLEAGGVKMKGGIPERINEWKLRVVAEKAKAMQSPLWPFFEAAVSPIYNEWMAFKQQDKYLAISAFTGWEVYEKWLERVKQLRAVVQAHGVKIETPEPADLAQSSGLLDIFKDAGKILKWGVIGALSIGGVFALTAAVSHLRRGSDPIERYGRLAKSSVKEK